jgi:hypothetical protein
MTMTPAPRLAAALLAAAALASCGTSKEDKAKQQVCDARSDIAKQVDTLKGLTISTASVDQIQTGLKAIGNDLKKIGDAQGDLSASRKQQVKDANQAFSSQVQSTVSDLGQSLSLSNAKSQLESALKQLASAYQSSFAKVDC